MTAIVRLLTINDAALPKAADAGAFDDAVVPGGADALSYRHQGLARALIEALVFLAVAPGSEKPVIPLFRAALSKSAGGREAADNVVMIEFDL